MKNQAVLNINYIFTDTYQGTIEQDYFGSQAKKQEDCLSNSNILQVAVLPDFF